MPRLPKIHGDLRLNLFRVTILLLFVVLWEVLSGPVLNSFFFSSPSKICRALIDFAVGKAPMVGILWPNLTITLLEMAEGYALGVLVGVPLGLFLSVNRYVGRMLRPFILGLYSIPKIILAPLFVLWFGVGIESKVAQVFVLVSFLVFFNTYTGVMNAPQILKNSLRTMGASPFQVVTKVVIPSAYPYIFVGLRASLPYALIGAIVGEFIASNSGIGFYIIYETSLLNTSGVFAGILIATVIAVVLDQGMKWLESRALRWIEPGRFFLYRSGEGTPGQPHRP